MRAARLHGPKEIRIEEVPSPEPGPNEVLVRVRAVAICPSDWRLYADGHAGGVVPERPIIQGHEFAGDIVALGRGVVGPPTGTRVAVDPSWHCGECDLCQRGLTNICRQVRFPSFPPQDGALAEYIACPAYSARPLPEQVSYIEGALTEPLGVALHAVRLACLGTDESVTVMGAGCVGVCTLGLAMLHRVRRAAVVEPVAGRREWPARLGARPVVASCEELLAAGHEADVVFECSGEDGAIAQAISLARPAGRVLVVGIPRSERATLDVALARRRELTLTFCRRSRDTLAESIALLESGQIDLSSVPVRQFPLEQTAEALEATAARPGNMLRAVVLP